MKWGYIIGSKKTQITMNAFRYIEVSRNGSFRSTLIIMIETNTVANLEITMAHAAPISPYAGISHRLDRISDKPAARLISGIFFTFFVVVQFLIDCSKQKPKHISNKKDWNHSNSWIIVCRHKIFNKYGT